MSIRLRLTLLYSAILVLVLTSFSIVLYLTLANSTREFMEDTLALEMTRLVRNNEFQSPVYIENRDGALGGVETYWQACDKEGNVLARTTKLDDYVLPLTAGGLQRLQAGESIYEVAEIAGIPFLIYSRPVLSGDQMTGILQVARSITEQEQALHVLRTTLASGIALSVLAAVGIGWLLSSAALHPIDHLTRTARMIETERSFERRIHYTGPPDEVGRLAATFNNMLAALHTAYQQVAQALQTQRSFLADASHELRTPLTTMRGNLALLKREPPITPEDRKAVLDDIVEENERMIRLVNDLLTLARSDNAPQIALEGVPLAPLFAEIERHAAGRNAGAAFSVDLADEITVLGQRDMLKQVLLILIDNAFKFTPAGGRIRLSARAKGRIVLMRVEDTGVGIAPEDLPNVFQRFYRGDPARSSDGYGLGLSIAKALVEQQGGAISVESALGQGTTFTITLNAYAEAAQTTAISPTAEPRGARSFSYGSNSR